jgi:hypothetical protein
MKQSWRNQWIAPCVALLAASSLMAADEKPAVSAGQTAYRGSAQARPISNAVPESGIKAPRPEAPKAASDATAPTAWETVEIAPAPSVLERMSSKGHGTDAQLLCDICMEGNASIAWNGNFGSFQLDYLRNYRSGGTSGTLRLSTKLASNYPVWGNTIFTRQQSSTYQLGTLGGGTYFYSIDSGSVSFANSSIPAGTYYLLMMSEEFLGGSSWGYTDYVVFPDVVTCNGASCTTTPAATCTPDSTTLCLYSNRFQVRATYLDYGNNSGSGHAVSLTSDTGYFWFFNSANVEAVGKIVNFCSGSTGNYGYYAGGLTDVGVSMTVTDTVTGTTKTFTNNRGNKFNMISASYFTCP